MTQQFVAADILVELVDRSGNVVAAPTFPRPTDEEWQSDPEGAAERNAWADEQEINWKEGNGIYARWRCSADRSIVTIHVAGNSETATCKGGHRWVRLFGEHDGYRQVR